MTPISKTDWRLLILRTWSWFYLNRYILSDIRAKTIFIFPSPVTLTFDLLTSKVLCQLLLMRVTFSLSLNVVWFSVFKLTTCGHLTDGVERIMRHPKRRGIKNGTIFTTHSVHKYMIPESPWQIETQTKGSFVKSSNEYGIRWHYQKRLTQHGVLVL